MMSIPTNYTNTENLSAPALLEVGQDTDLLDSYIEAGFALVPIPRGLKGPLTEGWNLEENCVLKHSDLCLIRGNVGLAHAFSKEITCAFDVDDIERTKDWFSEQGVDLALILNAPDAVKISSGRINRTKLLYKLKEARVTKSVTLPFEKSPIFELRCAAANGKTVQDVLPPSLHPDTGNPYKWDGGGHFSNLPDLPDCIASIWDKLTSDRKQGAAKSDLPPNKTDALKILDEVGPVIQTENGFPYSKFNEQWLDDAIDNTPKRVELAIQQGQSPFDAWHQELCGIKSLEAEQGWPPELLIEKADKLSRLCPGNYNYEQNLRYYSRIKASRDNGKTWRSILKGTPRPSLTLVSITSYMDVVDRTDFGNATLLCHITDGNLRYCHETGVAYEWNGELWKECKTGSVIQNNAIKVAHYYSDAAASQKKQLSDPALSEQDRKRIEKTVESIKNWETQCRSGARLRALSDLALKMDKISITVNQLNRDPRLLGVKNGVVDLATGVLHQASRQELVTKRCSVAFNPIAKAPLWESFIKEVTGLPIPHKVDQDGDVIPETIGLFKERPELARYLQKLVGYFATGLVLEDKMFFFTGGGGNGKDIFIKTVHRVLNDYACTLPPTALMTQRFESDAERPNPVVAKLLACRVAFSSEAKEGQQLDVALLKRHTGGGNLVARELHQKPVEFSVTHKLVLATNVVPPFDHIDDAMRARIHVVPFDRQWNRPGVTEPDPSLPDGDKNLGDKLKQEDEGILAWIVDGAVKYLKEGLTPPDEVISRTRGYIREQDCFEPWFAQYEKCIPRYGCSASDLFSDFKLYCNRMRRQPIPASSQAFAKRLRELGVVREHLRDGHYWGIQKRPQDTFGGLK